MRVYLLAKGREREREEKRIIMRRRMFNRGQNERKSLLASSLCIPQIFEYIRIYTYVYIYRSLLSFYLKKRTGEKEWKQTFSHNTKMKNEGESKKKKIIWHDRKSSRGIIF